MELKMKQAQVKWKTIDTLAKKWCTYPNDIEEKRGRRGRKYAGKSGNREKISQRKKKRKINGTN